MGDLSVPVGDRHALVERGGPEPERLSVYVLALVPKAHVVATARARVHLALARKVLTASVEEQIAHRRARIGAVERDRPDDAKRAPHGDGTGGEPPGTLYSELHISELPDQTDIDGIGRMPLGIGGPPCRRSSRRHDVVVALDERNQKIR
jgi:hypothetical protein